MSDIADYDKSNYKYETYWKGRQYEKAAEDYALQDLLKTASGRRVVDIGGSFGRLAKHYAHKFNEAVIVDYSLETLKRSEPKLKTKYSNLTLIAANAYKLPFKDSSFDGGLMVRVMHHLEDPKAYCNEVGRIISPDGIYVQEIPNKIHLKARIKALSRGNFAFFNEKPYEQPNLHQEKSVFYNYHPKSIEKLFQSSSFRKTEKRNCSFLRIPFIKKVVPMGTLLFLERLFQKCLSWTNLTPSIFYKFVSTKIDSFAPLTEEKLEDILQSPCCRTELELHPTKAICNACNKEFIKDGSIWDFRTN